MPLPDALLDGLDATTPILIAGPTGSGKSALAVALAETVGGRVINADALQLPFGEDTFDAVTISYGLRNVEDTLAALSEMHRVTKSGGRLVVAEFSTPTAGWLRTVYQRGALATFPVLSRLSSNPAAYDYLAESILAWPPQERLAELIAEAGWSDVEWRNLSGGIVALHRARKA